MPDYAALCTKRPLLHPGYKLRAPALPPRRRVREPQPRGVLAGGALAVLDAAHEILQPHVGGAAGLRDGVPLRRRDRIGGEAAAGGEDARVAVLRDRIALLRGLAEHRGGGALVFRNASPVEQRDRVFDLRREVATARGRGEQLRGRGRILRHAVAVLVERRQRVLRLGAAGVRRAT